MADMFFYEFVSTIDLLYNKVINLLLVYLITFPQLHILCNGNDRIMRWRL
jgi:hypothetical protein